MALAAAAYANFFTHHYLPDLRWAIAVGFVVVLWRSRVSYTVGPRRYAMPLSLSFVLIGFFLWVAENAATLLGAWQYPDQAQVWQMVHVGKWGSWALLVSLSFVLVGGRQDAGGPLLRRGRGDPGRDRRDAVNRSTEAGDPRDDRSMPELVEPTVAVRASFLAAMQEFADEGRGGDDTMVGSDLAEWADRWVTDEGFAAYVDTVVRDREEDAPRRPGLGAVHHPVVGRRNRPISVGSRSGTGSRRRCARSAGTSGTTSAARRGGRGTRPRCSPRRCPWPPASASTRRW